MILCSGYAVAWMTGESGFNSQWRPMFISLTLGPNRVCGYQLSVKCALGSLFTELKWSGRAANHASSCSVAG